VKNYSKYVESIFLLSKKQNYPLSDIESNWYMQRKFSESEEFRKIYSSYKKNNDFHDKDIKVKVPKDYLKKIKK